MGSDDNLSVYSSQFGLSDQNSDRIENFKELLPSEVKPEDKKFVVFVKDG